MRLIGASALLLGVATAEVSYRVKSNNLQFLRVRRKNSGFFEESRDDNMERECIEEMCSKEELSEVVNGDQDKINEEWAKLTRRCYEDKCDAKGTSVCVQVWNARTCTCKPGYKGEICDQDIDECKNPELAQKCDASQICINTEGSFRCECAQGFVETEGKCKDIDECANGTHECGENSKCVNDIGTYTCECNNGFEMDPDTNKCVDTDECADPDVCSAEAGICQNTIGSYTCGCAAGHKMGAAGFCEDIDECLEEDVDCGNGSCKNIPGSYVCECDVGFQNDNFEPTASCVDINECADEGACIKDQTCHNYAGGHKCCEASEDFDSNSKTCVARDPCEGVLCNANAKCVAGACVCNNGYTADSSDEGFLPVVSISDASGDSSGEPSPEELVCVDINECENSPCALDENCSNTPGSFVCSAKPDPCLLVDCGVGTCQAGFCNCPDGYENTADDKGCQPVVVPTFAPTTTPRPDPAPVNTCPAGFEGNPCVDKDECQYNNGGCSDMCMNYWGTKRCYGSLNEERSMCHHHDGPVTPTDPHKCKCFPGYKLCNDEFSCVTEKGYDEYNEQQKFKYQQDTSAQCASGQIGVAGTCFEVSSDKATYQGAVLACQRKGGKLAVLKSRLAWWAIGNNVNHGNSPFWVSASCKSKLLKMWINGKGVALLANPASNMANVPPQLNRASGADQHFYVCQF